MTDDKRQPRRGDRARPRCWATPPPDAVMAALRWKGSARQSRGCGKWPSRSRAQRRRAAQINRPAAACAAVRRAKLIPLSTRAGRAVEFNTALAITRPSFLPPFDETAQKREVYDLFLQAGIPARDGDHVIGPDPEPSAAND